MTAPLRQQIPLPSLSSCDRDGVTVVSLPGELDFCGSSALHAYLSDIRRQTRPRSVADLTGLAFIDSACLGVLVRHCTDSREQGGSFALAGPHGAVHRLLAVNGLLTWFDVHDTVEEAVSRTGPAKSRRQTAWVWVRLRWAAGGPAAKNAASKWRSHGGEENSERRQEQGSLQAAP